MPPVPWKEIALVVTPVALFGALILRDAMVNGRSRRLAHAHESASIAAPGPGQQHAHAH